MSSSDLLGKTNIKHAKNLIKFHDSNNIFYSQFDYINLEEKYYNKYKKISESEKENNTIFGFFLNDKTYINVPKLHKSHFSL